MNSRSRSIVYSLAGAFAIILFMGWARVAMFFRVKVLHADETKAISDLCARFGSLILRLTESALVIEGDEHRTALPPGRRVLLFSNHESNLDIPSVFCAMREPIGYIAKKELGRIPFLRFWIQRLGGIMLDRKDLRNSMEILSRAFGRADTRCMLIFPEGTRNPETTVAPFKAGSLRLALENDAVILPLCICGGRRKFEGNRYRVRPGKIYLRFLPARDGRNITDADKTETARSLHAEILGAYREFDARLCAEERDCNPESAELFLNPRK